jgi:hypothetical protein
MPAAKDGRPRTPQGWKILGGDTHCPSCKNTSYALRAVIIPITAPATGSWESLRAELRTLWSETTRCANWLVSELYSRDTRREPEDERLAAMRHTYLYPEARQRFPVLPPQAVSALAQDVLRQYRARRYDVLWTRSASLASYRYPVALTLPKQAWALHEEQGIWYVSVRLSDSRWRLRLRGGAPMRRQARRLSEIHGGTAERGSLTLYESRSTNRVMVKIAAWLPKIAKNEGIRVLEAGPDQKSLLAAKPQWRIDPSPIRSVLAADARRRASLLTNLQTVRRSGGRTDGIQRALEDLSRRTRQRLAEGCRTYAAHLASHAASSAVTEVRYDDRVRPKLSHFPWELLRRRVEEKLDERGIRFVYLSENTGDQPKTWSHQDGEHAA